MAFQPLNVASEWPDEPQYTASGKTDIGLVNPTITPVRYIVNATKPSGLAATDAFPVDHAKGTFLTLADGEKLWLVAPGQDPEITVKLTLMY